MEKLLRRYDVLMAVALFLAAILAERAEIFSLIEEQTLSFRQILRMSHGDVSAGGMHPDIVLVNTDETFFKSYGSFPLRRTDIARIVENLNILGAKIVGIDMLMDFPSSYGEDPAVAETLKTAGNTLLVAQAEFRDGRFVRINPPTTLLHAASPSAYTNISSSSTVITSLSRLKVYPELVNDPSGWPFAVALAAMHLGVKPRLEDNVLHLGERIRIPLDQFNSFLIDFPPLPKGTRFLSQSAGITALEFLDLSTKDENDLMELSYWVKDKIVLLGDTSEVSHDWFDTPVSMVYGVEIIADTLNTILKNAPLRPLSDAGEAAVALGMLAAMIGLAWVNNPGVRILGAVTLAVGFIGATAWLHVSSGVVVSMSYVLMALFFSFLAIEYYHYALTRNQKRQISKVFGQYIPSELVAEMNRSGRGVEIGGESREMTILFSDVRSFTTLSEGLTPQELTRLMNTYLSPMTRVIHKYRGTIDKYMGDAIMAFWGAPLEDDRHAEHAVRAGMEMLETLAQVNKDFASRGWKSIKIGVGLNTGVMNVGNMGSDFRVAYTVLGDAVNLGSRLEGLTKQYGVAIIVSETTLATVPGLVGRELDMVRVKGKDLPVKIYEPVAFLEQMTPEERAVIDRHHHGIALYRHQKWDEAAGVFAELKKAEPERTFYEIYMERIGHSRHNPPGPEWDGVFTHTSK